MKFLFSVFVLCLSIYSAAVAAETSDLPFSPAHAADQRVITDSALTEEGLQMKALVDWRVAKDKLEILHLKLEQAERDFKRAEALLERGSITKDAYAVALYAVKSAEATWLSAPSEVIKARTEAKVHMFRVLDEGNPEADHRREIVTTKVEGLKSEVDLLTESLPVAKLARDLAQDRLVHGQALGGALAITDLENRELSAKMASLKVDDIVNQITLMNAALEGYRRALVRLSSAGAR